MAINLDSFSQQLQNIHNSDTLYMKGDDAPLKGAGALGRLFHTQATYNKTVSAFAEAMQTRFGGTIGDPEGFRVVR